MCALTSRFMLLGKLLPLLLITFLCSNTLAFSHKEFVSPPDSAKPYVWWHWLNGNISKEGITKDLEWMKRSGVAGFTLFDGSMAMEKVIEGEIYPYGSPQWRDYVAFAIREAARLDLDMSVSSAPGWSETGGPWVKPDQAMKKLVWTEKKISNGEVFDGVLPSPFMSAGPFQDGPIPAPISVKPNAERHHGPDYYQDVAILAFRTPKEEVDLSSVSFDLSTSAEKLDAKQLFDQKYATGQTITFPEDGSNSWIEYSFEHAQQFQALTFAVDPPGGLAVGLPDIEIEVSSDGENYTTVFVSPENLRPVFPPSYPVATYSFNTVTAKHWRVQFKQPVYAVLVARPPTPAKTMSVSELAFHGSGRVNLYEAKAGYYLLNEYESNTTPELNGVIDLHSVLDLSSKQREDGTLDWVVPEGDWTLLRFGYSLTGAVNHPARDTAEGLEVDKLSKKHIRSYLDQYMEPFLSGMSDEFDHPGLQGFLIDSIEAGYTNWTEGMPNEFSRLRGYSLKHWMPVIAGYVLESPEASDNFLWDFRRTIADLFAENHWAEIDAFANKHELTSYAEAMGPKGNFLGDGLLNKGKVDVPMGEFWHAKPGEQPPSRFIADILEAGSAANSYDKNIVGAEAFTSLFSVPPFAAVPYDLKPVADQFMTYGVNRFFIHTSDHQPNDRGPGLTLGPFGQFFTRLESWAEMADGWTSYLARSSYLLQQGHSVADVAYFIGEGAPSTVDAPENLAPSLPKHYQVDFVNRDTLLNQLDLKNGKLVSKSGNVYRLLVLPENNEAMSEELIEKIAYFVKRGLVVLGPKPSRVLSIESKQKRVEKLAKKIWGEDNQVHNFGKGRVYPEGTIENILEAEGATENFSFSGDHNLVYTHRKTEKEHIWFVANQNNSELQTRVSLRVTGKKPELWNPVTGERSDASYTILKDSTSVDLSFGAYESVFVIFKDNTDLVDFTVGSNKEISATEISGPWKVKFEQGRGAPESIELNELSPLEQSDIDGVKYFAGVATYTTSFNADQLKGKTVTLRLNDVSSVAKVQLNDCELGSLWMPPYDTTVTECLVDGENTLTIDVASLWPNRLIGDAQPGVEEPIAFTTFPFPFYKADSPLMKSGLIGPVELISFP